MSKMIRILSIDAWANGEDGWTWNMWYKVGECPLETCDLPPAEIVAYMISEGYLQDAATTLCDIEDDQYNVVVTDKETGEPLFALEYGPAVY